jgi:hypothetical protein
MAHVSTVILCPQSCGTHYHISLSNGSGSQATVSRDWNDCVNAKIITECRQYSDSYFKVKRDSWQFCTVSGSGIVHQVTVKIMLRRIISLPVCLGNKPTPFGAHDKICVTVRQLRVYWCGTPSLTRGQFWHLTLPALAYTVILVS